VDNFVEEQLMTAIVGLVANGSVYIGGDSAGSNTWQMSIRSDAKVFRNGPYLMGFTTSFRMGQLIRYGLAAPKPEGDLDQFMATSFIDAVRDCLKAGGWARKENDREEGGTFLVGVHGRLFTVHEDYQVAQTADGYAAVGSGDAHQPRPAQAGTAGPGGRRAVQRRSSGAVHLSTAQIPYEINGI
jgi:hypothetical protein